MTYYLIYTKPREEARAQHHLTNQGYACFLPQYSCEKIKDGKRITTLTPLFPRYLFIRLNEATDNWAPIRSTLGVSQMVRFGLRWATVEDAFIQTLQERLEQMKVTPQALYQPGQSLKVVDGPFAGLDAIFKENDGEARVVVLLNFLQQQKPISMPIGAVQSAA
jgi:transcriptional antiterminator RfaH